MSSQPHHPIRSGSGDMVANSANIGTDSKLFKQHMKGISGSAAGVRIDGVAVDPYREQSPNTIYNFQMNSGIAGRHSSNPNAIKNL